MNQLFETPESGAQFSKDRTRRFALWRVWDETLPRVMFIGLNPSTANATEPDNTIKKVIKISKFNGFGGLYMLNLFTFITPYPDQLQNTSVVEDFEYLEMYGKSSYSVVFCWGNFNEAIERAKRVQYMFRNAFCLHKNKNGSPKHPLYCKDESKLLKF